MNPWRFACAKRPWKPKKKNEARAALNALLRENEITFTDRNARLYDTINAAF